MKNTKVKNIQVNKKILSNVATENSIPFAMQAREKRGVVFEGTEEEIFQYLKKKRIIEEWKMKAKFK